MKGSQVRTWLVVMALGVALLGAGPTNDSPGSGTVTGRVIDLDGRPVKGAEVWAGDRGQAGAMTLTGADGRFRLGSVSEERATTVWAEYQDGGLAREHFADVRVHAARETDLGNITLAPGARFAGRVVDAHGRPVAGAKATIVSRHHILGHTVTQNGPSWTVKGDNQGRFEWPVVPIGNTEITVRAPSKAGRSLNQLVEPGKTTIDLGEIRLDDERPITGTVVDQDGQPITGAQVVVDADYDHPAISDDKGRFTVHDAALDAAWFLVEARGYFDPTLRPIHELKGQRTDLRLPLQKAFTVEGSVIDAETGEPVEFDVVQLCTVRRDDDAKITLVG